MGVLSGLLTVYVVAAFTTALVIARDHPWRVSPPRPASRWQIASGVVINGLLWPILLARAVRRGW